MLSATCISHATQQHLTTTQCCVQHIVFKCTVTNIALELRVETSNSTAPQYYIYHFVSLKTANNTVYMCIIYMCVRIAYMNYCTKSLLAITKLSHFSDLDIITHTLLVLPGNSMVFDVLRNQIFSCGQKI